MIANLGSYRWRGSGSPFSWYSKAGLAKLIGLDGETNVQGEEQYEPGNEKGSLKVCSYVRVREFAPEAEFKNHSIGFSLANVSML
ncbi:hypothetical protein AgCh_012928 [Apium graveolens]